MSILKREDVPYAKMQVDLSGPQGNAHILLGICQNIARQLKIDFEPIKKDAMSSDYEYLLSVLDKHFGHVVDFIR